jgi:flagellar L-ring protein precursor FlgH
MNVKTGFICIALAALQFFSSAGAASLYHAETFVPLTSDIRSFKVGDAVTVQIVEASSAQTQAESIANRDANFLGTLQGSSSTKQAGLELQRKMDNAGSTTRSGTLQASISVRIQEVAANGDLVVRGSQTIMVNGEVQKITVSGVVRPIDVSSDNIVASTRLTNAQIEYTGRGFVDRSQRESWISRMFGALGL